MIRCVTGSRMNMLADVWSQTTEQDSVSGSIRRVWTYNRTISCIARGILDGGIRVAGTTETWGDTYEAVDWIKLTAQEPLSRREQITNVRNEQGHVLWVDREVADTPPTSFDVKGSQPVIDPFGNVIEYQTLLQRIEVPQ